MAVMRSGTEGETEIVAVINIMYRTFKDKRYVSLYKNRGMKMCHKYLLYCIVFKHLSSVSNSVNHSEVLPLLKVTREEMGFEKSKGGWVTS